MPKSVVFIGHYNGGKDDFDTRHFFFAKELVGLGYKTTIINAAFSHRIHDAKLIDNQYISHIDSGVSFFSIKTPFYKGNGLRRIVNMFAFVLNLIKCTKKLLVEIGNIDVIIMASPHPFAIFAAKFMANKAKAKLIIDIKDIWPLSITELTSAKKYHPFVMLTKLTELFAYRVQDKIISPLNNINEYFYDSGLNIQAKHIPTGLDLDFYENINHENLQINIPSDKFIVGYIGGITKSNAIEFLLESANYFLQNYKDILFLVVGDGSYKNNLVKKYNSSNILYIDAVKEEEAFMIMSKCDVLYRAMLPLKIYSYGISPLKMNEYMFAGVPIVHSFDYKEHDIVMKVGCGISVKSGSMLEIQNAILKIYNMPKEEREKMGQNGKEYVKNNLSYKVLVKKMIEVL